MEIKVRESKWDNIKVVMMIGIVLEHAIIIYDYPRNLELLWGGFIAFLMPLFTLISGYWHKPKNIGTLVKTYIKPMLLFSAINFFVGYFFYPKYHSGIHLIGYAMWYLWALFIFSLISPLLLNSLKIRTIVIFNFLLIVAFCMLPSFGIFDTLIRELQINRLIGFYPFFLLGIMLNKYEENIRFYCKKPLLVWILIMSYTIYVFLCYAKHGFAYSSGFYLINGASWDMIVKWIINYILIAVATISLVLLLPNKHYPITKYGARTLSVYVLHMLLVFPISWGIFYHISPTVDMMILNAVITCSVSLFLFHAEVNSVVLKFINIRGGVLTIVYILSLLLVNSSIIKGLFQNLV